MNKIYNTLKSADKVTLLLILVLGFVSLLMLESTIYDDGFVFSWEDGIHPGSWNRAVWGKILD